MNTRRAALAVVLIALTACVSILGLDSNNFESFDGALCKQYSMICGTAADDLKLGISSTNCLSELARRLDASSSDPARPNVQKYTELHCREKTTCAELLDCLAGANVIAIPANTCAGTSCLGEAIDAGARPWRCCPNETCLSLSDSSVCQTEPFSCMGKVPLFAKPDPLNKTYFTVRLSFVDVNTRAPINDVMVHACARLDPDCQSPLAAPDTDAGAPGDFLFHLPLAFDGFLEVLYVPPLDGGPDLDYVTLLVHIFPPLDADYIMSDGMMMMGAIPLFRRSVYEAIGKSFDNTVIDWNLGNIFGFTLDCKYQPAAGVVGTLDVPPGVTLYFMGTLPSKAATQTDMTGQLGFVNVKPGIRTITTSVRGARAGTIALVVRRNSLSFAALPLTP